jgi:hypothetical protein
VVLVTGRPFAALGGIDATLNATLVHDRAVLAGHPLAQEWQVARAGATDVRAVAFGAGRF